jgi:hypothetical protein
MRDELTKEEEKTGILEVIYKNGKFYNEPVFSEIRERLDK